MPFICLRRTDIPSGTLQVTDLWPNKSKSQKASFPVAQGPRYIAQPTYLSTVVLASTGGTQRSFKFAVAGLAAYIMANVQEGGAGGHFTSNAHANTEATALVTAMRAGSALTLTAINAILATTGGAGTELTTLGGSISTGTVMDVLRIISGASYTVPAGTIINTAGNVFNPQSSPATWNANNFNFNTYSDILATDNSFYISLAEGQLSKMTAGITFHGITSAGVTVYDNTGNIL